MSEKFLNNINPEDEQILIRTLESETLIKVTKLVWMGVPHSNIEKMMKNPGSMHRLNDAVRRQGPFFTLKWHKQLETERVNSRSIRKLIQDLGADFECLIRSGDVFLPRLRDTALYRGSYLPIKDATSPSFMNSLRTLAVLRQ